tara:strand:+ start:1801 stop:3015 length:1215 start_codon:yes stop_codon:yes gene_type:complete
MQKSKYFIILIYLVLLSAFFLNADPNGGAFKDYQNHLIVINDFKENFFKTLFNYDNYETRHSPVLYSILSFFYYLEVPEKIIRLFFVHIGILLPIIFYKCLKLKFVSSNKEILFLFSCLILLSPSFWSLTIWPDSRIFGLILFCISIFYFLKFKEDKKLNNSIKCILSYSAASYLSPNFAIFAIFYFYHFFKTFKISKEILIIIIINIILSLPAFLYLFSLESIFLFKSAVPSNEVQSSDLFNVSNKILIISSIIFFYSIPFLIVKSFEIKKPKINTIILSLILLILLSYNFNYNYSFTGGGIFFKLSHFISNNNYLFFLICFFSILLLINLIKLNFENFIIIFLLILSNPQYTIYHKYYDPLILILFSLLFNIKINQKNLFNFNSLIIFYIHIGSFLILNFIK